ncbi:hypothetical protein [Actinomadura algeriensis]|uniref:DUF5666 domain-containing protein n=1 Tax=Actinomadura algeriensis TaxID=1679523 RepID=A0ABR9JRM5_9ACTN|nr:hypothetical protein [Actinomadura algeriensis]MBE1532785.1 hypothetical protein [Actinomadura algeriensis]
MRRRTPGPAPQDPLPPPADRTMPDAASERDRDAELLAGSPFDDDLDAALAARARRRTPPRSTLLLAAAIVLVAGFLGGVQAQKHMSDGAAPSAGGGGPAAGGGYGGGRPGGSGPQGGGMPGRAGGGTTAGTVTKIDGAAIYVRTSAGKTVKVQTSGDTQITVTGKLQDLGTGTPVVVRGAAGEDGTVAATAVNEGTGDDAAANGRNAWPGQG